MVHVKYTPQFQNPGDPIYIKYSSKVMDDGRIQLTPSGKINIQEKINSYRDSCDINVILRRLKNGDLAAMDAFNASPLYGDFTEFPKGYREVLQFQIDTQRHFDELPTDVKAKFNNDYNQFIAAAFTDEWVKKLGITENEEEVKADGQE